MYTMIICYLNAVKVFLNTYWFFQQEVLLVMHSGESCHQLLPVSWLGHSYLCELISCNASEEVGRVVACLFKHGEIGC